MQTVLPADKALSVAAAIPSELAAGARQLRVLHVINRLDLGGTESGIMKVIAGLGNGEFAHAVCTARGHSPEFAKRHSCCGEIFDAAGEASRARFLLPRFRRIIRQYRPHIVHSRNWGAIEAVFAARLAGTPVVVHSEHGYELDMLKGLPVRRRLLRRMAYAAADTVFTVTSDLQDYHAREAGVSRDRIAVLANGVDAERFAPRLEKKLACRASLGLPQNMPLLGTVGRLVPIKRHALLLRAAEILIQRGFQIGVALAGDGPELENLRALASAPHLAGRVHFVGASRNIADFLNAVDVFVLPSESEGMSNTLLEAMASGLPVVATRVGGNVELVEDGVSGRLVRAGDVDELVAHLAILTTDAELCDTLGKAARARILTAYALDFMLDRYRNLYRELAARKKILTMQAVH